MKFTFAGIDIGVTAKFVKAVYGFPFSPNDKHKDYHNQFRVKILYDGIERTFPYYDSTAAYYEGKVKMTDKDLRNAFECLITDALPTYRDFDDFCREFGYETDSRNAESIYKTIQKHRAKVLELGLTDSQLNSISEAMHEEE